MIVTSPAPWSAAAPSARARVIAEVVYGRSAQRKAVLAPGASLVIGADVPSQFRVIKDRALSKQHFKLFWREGRCWLRDLDSVGGTQLDGKSVTEAPIPHGSWVRAGRTDFMVYYEHHTPYVSDDGAPAPTHNAAVTAAKEAALQRLRGEQQQLYAVLDAACARYVRILLHESVEHYQSLYEGLQGEALAEVAPHLVRLHSPAHSTLLEKLVTYGWGNRWGIFLTSSLRFSEVRRHLRRFLIVNRHGSKRRLYFRFYDPVALSVFMRVATPQQREAFSEGIRIVPLGEPRAPLRWAGDNT